MINTRLCKKRFTQSPERFRSDYDIRVKFSHFKNSLVFGLNLQFILGRIGIVKLRVILQFVVKGDLFVRDNGVVDDNSSSGWAGESGEVTEEGK